MQRWIFSSASGSRVPQHGYRRAVRNQDRFPREVPLGEVAAVVLFGRIHLTTPAACLLLRHAAPVAFLSSHGRLAPAVSTHVELPRVQNRFANHLKACLRMACPPVEVKRFRAISLLVANRTNDSDPELARCRHESLAQLDRARCAATLNHLRGCGGAPAALHFRALARLNRSGLPFPARRRNPPPDPINALLSLGYTLTTAEHWALAATRGLDPYVGFQHTAGRRARPPWISSSRCAGRKGPLSASVPKVTEPGHGRRDAARSLRCPAPGFKHGRVETGAQVWAAVASKRGGDAVLLAQEQARAAALQAAHVSGGRGRDPRLRIHARTM
ncbi:MAG: CRISPR-associated endonuclease Cas1 [Bryobacteraceae bacterium]